MGAGTRRTPVQVVTGFPGQGAHELIAGWLQDKPASERWAVIVNGLAGLGALGRFDAPVDGGIEVLQVSGCGCCIAGPAFSTTLGRLLKRGPWDLVILDASGQAHAGTLVERVQGVGRGAGLAVLPPVLAIDVTRASAYINTSHAAHSTALDWLELSPGRVLWGGARGTSGSDKAAGFRSLDALLNGIALQTGLPHRIWQTEDGRVPWAAVHAELACMLTLAEGAGARCWAPTQRFDRPRLQTGLHALADRLAATAPPETRAQGVFRTERAWYAWQWRRQGVTWQESGWRMDSRIKVLVPGGVDPTYPGQGLLALDAALGPD